LTNYLKQVNYYRLSGYLWTFKTIYPLTQDEIYKPNTTFEIIKNQYEFDRQLRLLLMDAIERIEISILRTRLVEINSLKFGPFGYIDKKNYNPKFPEKDFNVFLKEIAVNEKRSYEEFINRYRKKYTSEKYLPLWMSVELMSFGHLFTFYRNQHLAVKQELSHRFGVFPPVLDSWLHTLLYIRNACAHHVRIWNKPLPLPPKIPDYKYDLRWYTPIKISNNHIFAVLTIIAYLMDQINTETKWKLKVKTQISENPSIPINAMGFPKDWEDVPFWQ
jgi:abortive infection bacteriophage resistance protein